jgi:hypothetical protein
MTVLRQAYAAIIAALRGSTGRGSIQAVSRAHLLLRRQLLPRLKLLLQPRRLLLAAQVRRLDGQRAAVLLSQVLY